MAIADPRDRLQPALLDRITDDVREPGAVDDRRVMSKAQLRQAGAAQAADEGADDDDAD